MSRDASTRLAALVERCEAEPSAVSDVREDGDQLALEVEGELGLRWRVAVVQSVMADPPDGDAVRELYGELVDRYRDNAERLARLKPLGAEIRRREAEGTLPSVLVARSDRRRK